MNGQLQPTRSIVFASENAISEFIYRCQLMANCKPKMYEKSWRQLIYDMVNDIFRQLEPSSPKVSRIAINKCETPIEPEEASPSMWSMTWYSDRTWKNAVIIFTGKIIRVQSSWDSELTFDVLSEDGTFKISS